MFHLGDQIASALRLDWLCCRVAWRERAALLLPLLLCAGCKSQPYVNAHIESVNAEYRQLEDYVYALEAENARLTQEIEMSRTGTPRTGRRPPAPRQDTCALRAAIYFAADRPKPLRRESLRRARRLRALRLP